jgi:hypothetical protein
METTIPLGKFKIRDLKAIETSLSKLLDSRLPVKTSYRLTKFSKKIMKELGDLEKARLKFINDFGVKNGKGETEVGPERMGDFRKQMDALLDEEVELPVMKVPLADLEGSLLTAADIANLEFIIEGGGNE